MSELAISNPGDRLEPYNGAYTLAAYADLMYDQQLAYESAMRAMLEPLYGPQDAALEKIHRGQDRQAEVVMDGSGVPAATLVYKTDLTSEIHWDMRFGDTVRTIDAFEVKTLALFNPDKDGGRGIATSLLQRADMIANSMGANGIVLTVTDESGAKDFFTRHGYSWSLYKTASAPALWGHVVYKSLRQGGLDTNGRWFS